MRSKKSKSVSRKKSGGAVQRKSKRLVSRIFGSLSHPLNSKNSVHDPSGITMLSLPKNPSFAVKLGAYMLEGLQEDIFFSKKTAFSGKQKQVSGVLPFLHMNIKENEFRDLIERNASSLGKSVAKVCNKKDLNKKLVKVGFNCNKQAAAGVVALNMGLIDSINNRYAIRKNGQRKLAEIYSYQSWQHNQPDSKIPAASLNYAK